MNIKELLNIFTEDVINEIKKISKINNEFSINFNTKIIEPDIYLVLKNEEVTLQVWTDNRALTIESNTLNTITKIKSQWEDYISKKEHLEKMCEVTEWKIYC